MADDTRDQIMRKAESNWRRVPTISRAAIRFVRDAAPGYLRRVWGLQALGGVASALSVGVTAILARKLLKIESSSSALSTLLPAVIALTVLGLISQFVSAYQTVSRDVVSEQVGRAAYDRILDVVGTVDLEAFDDADFRNRLEIAESQSQIRPWQVVESVSNLTRAGFTIVGILVGLIVLSPLTVFAVIAIVAPIAVVIGTKTQIEHEFVRDRSLPERFRGAFSWKLTNKDGATDARSHALTGEIRRRINALNVEILDMKRIARKRQAKLAFLSNAGVLVIVGATITVLAWLFDRGSLTIPTAIAMLFGLLRVQGTIGLVGYSVGLLHEGALFLHDVDEFLAYARSRSTGQEQPVTARDRPPLQSLRAEAVSFRYANTETFAVSDVSLTLRAGRVVAFVGENGSGKTTMAKIFAGLYRPTNGTLQWDHGDGTGEHVVGPGDLGLVRSATAIVPQNVYGTSWPVPAHQHVAFGDVTRLGDLDGAKAAADRAGATDFVEKLDHGWDTILNSGFPNGTDLSGGQWQRLAIARAFFRDAPLLIMDEPTAALDAKAEHDVFARVMELAKGRAVLLISHRFSTVRMADEIVVFDGGRIVEHGSHDELMAINGGRYAEMYTLQADALLRPDAR
jgi:ATP-binding cassette, subfamily B, bacterial